MCTWNLFYMKIVPVNWLRLFAGDFNNIFLLELYHPLSLPFLFSYDLIKENASNSLKY